MDWIKVFAPATIGNIGPGFDVLGMAVRGWGDTLYARATADAGVFLGMGDNNYSLPTEPLKNTAGIAAAAVLEMLGERRGVELLLQKGIPAGSGLGSSAASACAAAFATNYLYGGKLSKDDLILAATKAEEVVSGSFFADNTSPCLLGGATLTRSCVPLDVTAIGHIDSLYVVLVKPELTVLTKDARDVLPKMIPMADFVANMANTALITVAFARNDYSLFARSLHDVVVEPVRAKLIKGFDSAKKAALAAGADGMTISGSGPAVFAITESQEKAEQIQKAMVEAFKAEGVAANAIVTTVDKEGTRLLVE